MGNQHGSGETNYKHGRDALKDKDYAKAFGFFKKAADEGHLKSQRAVGKMYLKGRGVDKNPAEAAQWFRKAAKQGSPPAQYQYALMCQAGQGVEKNEAEAAKFFKYAAEDGDPKAQVEYGKYVEGGLGGVKQSKSGAKDWYERAADQGYLPGIENLARIMDKAPFQQEMDCIERHLYLGSLIGAENQDNIKKYKITHNLYLHNRKQKELPGVIYKKIGIDDVEHEDIGQYFVDCFKWVDEAIKKGGVVLVNCQAGMSRSASIVVMYLMTKKKWTVSDTIHFVSIKRAININEGFLKQLRAYEKEILL